MILRLMSNISVEHYPPAIKSVIIDKKVDAVSPRTRRTDFTGHTMSFFSRHRFGFLLFSTNILKTEIV